MKKLIKFIEEYMKQHEDWLDSDIPDYALGGKETCETILKFIKDNGN